MVDDEVIGFSEDGQEIERVQLVNGVRFVLPKRNILAKAGMPLFLASVGVLIAAHAFSEFFGILHARPWMLFDVIQMPFFALLGFVALGAAIYIALPLLIRRSEVDLMMDALIARDWIGPVPIVRRRSGRIIRFDLCSKASDHERNPTSDRPGEDRVRLMARLESGRRLTVAPYYRMRTVLALAERLARESVDGFGHAIEVREQREFDLLNPIAVPPQPERSRLVVETKPDGLLIIDPPRGMIRGPAGALVIALMAIMVAFVAAAVTLWGMGLNPLIILGILMPFGVSLFLVVVGVRVLLLAIDAGRSFTRLDVDGERLRYSKAGTKLRWFHSEYTIRRSQIESISVRIISCGDNETRNELMIHLVEPLRVEWADQEVVNLSMEVSDEERIWIAAMLRETLDIPACK